MTTGCCSRSDGEFRNKQTLSNQKEEVSEGVFFSHQQSVLLVGTGTPELKPLCAERSHQCTNGGKGLLVCGQWTLLL